MTRQRDYRTIHYVGLLRAWHAAWTDHRENPSLPTMRPLDSVQRDGSAKKLRSYKWVNRAQIARSILRQRGRRRRQRRHRGA